MNFISTFDTLSRLYEESSIGKPLRESVELGSRSADLNDLARQLAGQLEVLKYKNFLVKTFSAKNALGSSSCIAITVEPEKTQVQKTVVEACAKDLEIILNSMNCYPEITDIKLFDGKHWIVFDNITKATTEVIK